VSIFFSTAMLLVWYVVWLGVLLAPTIADLPPTQPPSGPLGGFLNELPTDFPPLQPLDGPIGELLEGLNFSSVNSSAGVNENGSSGGDYSTSLNGNTTFWEPGENSTDGEYTSGEDPSCGNTSGYGSYEGSYASGGSGGSTAPSRVPGQSAKFHGTAANLKLHPNNLNPSKVDRRYGHPHTKDFRLRGPAGQNGPAAPTI